MTEKRNRVLIISSDSSDADEIKLLLEEDGSHFIFYTAEPSLLALDTIYNELPDLVIVSQSLEEDKWRDLCSRVKTDTFFAHLPILLILQRKC